MKSPRQKRLLRVEVYLQTASLVNFFLILRGSFRESFVFRPRFKVPPSLAVLKRRSAYRVERSEMVNAGSRSAFVRLGAKSAIPGRRRTISLTACCGHAVVTFRITQVCAERRRPRPSPRAFRRLINHSPPANRVKRFHATPSHTLRSASSGSFRGLFV